MKLSVVVLCILVAFQALLVVRPAAADLSVGYYNKTCSNVESIVRDIVGAALAVDRGKGAGLVRLLFHDCFVRGCDASVLLDPTAKNPHPEKTSGANIGLRGVDVIDAIKAKLEATCPGIVSCADIIAFAARDAAYYLSYGGISFAAPAGRLDSVVSLASDADYNLPGSTFNLQQLIDNFAAKNFTIDDMVVLSGAHSIGVAHCSSFRDRLYAPPDQINPVFRNILTFDCRAANGPDPTVANNIRDQYYPAALGSLTSYIGKAIHGGKDYLDNSYYTNNLNKLVLFKSDWELVTGNNSLSSVNEYANNGTLWNEDFGDALVKLSKLPMPPGSEGQIRTKCSAIN